MPIRVGRADPAFPFSLASLWTRPSRPEITPVTNPRTSWPSSTHVMREALQNRRRAHPRTSTCTRAGTAAGGPGAEDRTSTPCEANDAFQAALAGIRAKTVHASPSRRSLHDRLVNWCRVLVSCSGRQGGTGRTAQVMGKVPTAGRTRRGGGRSRFARNLQKIYRGGWGRPCGEWRRLVLRAQNPVDGHPDGVAISPSDVSGLVESAWISARSSGRVEWAVTDARSLCSVAAGAPNGSIDFKETPASVVEYGSIRTLQGLQLLAVSCPQRADTAAGPSPGLDTSGGSFAFRPPPPLPASLSLHPSLQESRTAPM